MFEFPGEEDVNVDRIERLNRLAEKAQQEVRLNEEALMDLSRRIDDAASKLDTVHAFESKRNCDAMERGLKTVEESVRGLFRDCQMLQDGNHPQADHLHKRVSDLQSRVSQLRNHLYSQLVHPLLSRPQGERTITPRHQSQVASESRLLETNPAFRHLQDCLEWVDAKQRLVEEGEYDNDLSRVEEFVSVHKGVHQEVQAFRSRIDQCINARTSLSAEEQKTYTQNLSKVEVAYSLLSKTSARRLRCLENLNDFLHAATMELVWLSEKEDVELARDWGSKDINLVECDEQHKSLVRQMEAREGQFNAVQEKGGAMILDRHPLSRTVEAYMSSLQSQWSWLVHLSWCLEAHIKHSVDHNKFFEEAQHCQQWMARHSELLHNRFSSDNIPIDQAQVLLADLQDLQSQIREYDRRVSSLVVRSHDILPLKLRSQPLSTPTKVRTLCPYHQDISLQRGEECFLVGKSQRPKWKVKTMTGVEATVPSVCLLIPPPNQDAIDLANRLKLQHERLTGLWKNQQRRVRMAAIFAAIKQIKGWDLKQFLAMDPAQREAVWHALKEDGNKLIAECGTSDRDMRKLAEELRQCEQIYRDLSDRASAKETKKVSTAQIFLQRVEAVGRDVSTNDQQLSALVHRPIPQNNLAVQESFRSYREFQLKFEKTEGEIRTLRVEVKELRPPNPSAEAKLNLVVEKCDQIKVISHVYVDRLKGCEVVISGVNDLKQLVSEFEGALASHDNMSSNLVEIRSAKADLVAIFNGLGERRHQIEAVNRHGGQYIREAKLADKRLKQFKDIIGQDDTDGRSKKSRGQDGTDVVMDDLDQLNKKYMEAVDWATSRLKQITTTLSYSDMHFQMVIDEDLPLLRTFRAELAKPSSMLLDDDMKEFFTLQFDEPSSSQLSSSIIKPSHASTAQATPNPQISTAQFVPKRADELKASAQPNRTSLTELSMTLKALESPSSNTSRSATPTVSTTSMVSGLKLTPRPNQQTLVTVRKEEIIPRGQLLHTSAILNRQTSQKVTLVEALQAGVLDSKTKMYNDLAKRQRMSLQQAAKKRFIDEVTLKQLTSFCGLEDPNTGSELSLMDAIQKKLYNPRDNVFIDMTTGEQISVSEAVCRGMVSESCSRLLAGEKVEITNITSTLATFASSEPLRLESDLSIGKIIEKGLYREMNGKVTNPATGADLNIMEAVENGLINPTFEEIEDLTTGKYISLTDAVSQGMVDPFKGTYYHKPTNQNIPLSAAMIKGMVKTATSISDLVTNGNITEDGEVFDFVSGQIVPMSQALASGVVSKEKKCILDPKTNKTMNVTEAVEKGIMTSFGVFNDSTAMKGRQHSLLDAVKNGIVKLVQEDLEFSRTGVKDPRTSEVLTFSEAINRGIITPQGNYVDNRTRREMTFQQAANAGLMDRSLVKDLSKPTSIVDGNGRNLSIVEALQKGILDPEGGSIENLQNKEKLSMQDATALGLVSSTDADIILKLVSRMTSSTTVLTQLESSGRSENAMPLSQALAAGLLNENTGLFKDSQSGREIPIQDALRQGMIKLSTDWPDSPSLSREFKQTSKPVSESFMTDTSGNTTKTIPIEPGSKTIESCQMAFTSAGYSFTTTAVAKPLVKQSAISEVKEINLVSVKDTRTGRELDVESALKRGLVDLEKGEYTDKSRDEVMSIKDAIDGGFIQAEECSTAHGDGAIKETKAFSIVGVLHPKTKERLSVSEALRQGILDQENGVYNSLDARGRKSPMKISDAISEGLVIVEDLDSDVTDPDSLLRETKSYILKTVIHPVSKKHMTIADAISAGILDESEGVYVNTRTGERIPIHDAIEQGLILAKLSSVNTDVDEDVNKITTTKLATLNVTAVVDPRNGTILPVARAIEEGILNQTKGIYTNPQTGETMSVGDAIDRRLVLAESPEAKSGDELEKAEISSIHIGEEEDALEATLVEDVHTETVTLSIHSVIDPISMEMISYDKAVKSGVLDTKTGMYKRPDGTAMTISMAMEKGLIHGEVTSRNVQEDTMRSSVTASTPSFPLKDITSVIDPRTRDVISYDKALKDGIINLEKGVYCNPRTGLEINLQKAKEIGYLLESKVSNAEEVEQSMVEEELLEAKLRTPRVPKESQNTWSKVDMELEKTMAHDEPMEESYQAREVLHYTTDVEEDQADGVSRSNAKSLSPKDKLPVKEETKPSGKGISYMEASRLGLINPQTKRIRDPRSGELLTIPEAIQHDVIDPRLPAMEEPINGKSLSLNECIDKGILNPVTGNVDASKLRRAGLTDEATPECPSDLRPMNLIDAVHAGLFNKITKQFMEPKSGHKYTLQKALSNKIIDGIMVAVVDTQTGKRVPLNAALLRGLINGNTSDVYDTERKTVVPLPEAIASGLVQNKYDVDSECIEDSTGDKIPLRQAIMDGDLDAETVIVLDTKTGEQVPVNEALMRGMVDRSGSIVDKDTGRKLSPTDALKFGLLAIVGAPVMAGKMVVDAIKDKTKTNDSDEISYIPHSSRAPATSRTMNESPERRHEHNDRHSPQSSRAHATSRTMNESPERRHEHNDRHSPHSSRAHATSRTMNESPERRHEHNDRHSPQSSRAPTSRTMNESPERRHEHNDRHSPQSSRAPTSRTMNESPERRHEHNDIHSPQSSRAPTSRTMNESPERRHEHNGRHSPQKLVTEKLGSPVTINIEEATPTPTKSHRFNLGPGEDRRSDSPQTFDLTPSTPYATDSPVQKSPRTPTREEMMEPVKRANLRSVDIDWESGTVLDQLTGQRMTVPEAVQKGLLDSEVVEDMATSSTPQTQSTPEIHINWEKGSIADTTTGEVFTIDKALQKGLIDMPTASALASVTETAVHYANGESKTYAKPSTQEPYTLNRAVKNGAYNPVTGQIIEPKTGLQMSVKESMIRNVIDGNRSQVIDPQTGEQNSLNEAVSSKIFDPLRGELIQRATKERISLQDAYFQGLIPDEDLLRNGQGNQNSGEPALTLEEAITKGYIDRTKGSFTDPLSGETMPLASAIEYGLIASPSVTQRPKESRLSPEKAAETEAKRLSFGEALDKGLINLESQQYTDPESGNRVALLDAIRDQIIDTSTPVTHQETKGMNLTEAIEEGIFDERTGTFHDPQTGAHLSFQEAVASEKLDGKFTVYEVKTGEIFTLEEGIEEGKIDPKTGKFIDESGRNKMTLKDAAKLGALAIIGAPYAAAMAAKESFSSFLDKGTEETAHSPDLAFQAVTVKQLSPNMLEVTQQEQSVPTEDDGSMTLMEAVSSGYLNSKTGMFKDPETGKQMEVSDAIMEGLINKDSATVENPRTGEMMNLEDALRLGVLDDHGHIVDDQAGTAKDLKDSIKDGSVKEVPASQMADSGCVFTKTTEKLKIDSVYDPISKREVSLPEAIKKNIIHLEDATYQDLKTGKVMSLSDAVEEGRVHCEVIDKISTKEETTNAGLQAEVAFSKAKKLQVDSVMDTARGQHIPLSEAIRRGIVDKECKHFKDSQTSSLIPMDEAIQHGLVTAKPVTAKESFQKSELSTITQMSSVKVQSVIDPATNQELPVSQAIEKGILDVSSGTVTNTMTDEQIPIGEALKMGLVKGYETTFVPPNKDDSSKYPEEEALNIQSVYDPLKNKNIAVADAVASGLIDLKSGTYNDPARQDPISLQQAYQDGLIAGNITKRPSEPETVGDFKIRSAVDTSKDVRLSGKDAVRAGIISKKKGDYLDREKNEKMPILEAVKQGLVTLESDIPEPVFAPIVEKITTVTSVIDPATGKELTVSEAMGEGIFDSDHGEIINTRTGERIPFDSAIEQGLISADVEEGQKAREVVVINGVLITDAKDPRTGKFIPVSEAIEKGIINEELGFYNDTRRAKTLREALKEGLIKGKETSELPEQTTKDAKQINVLNVKDPISSRQVGLEEAIGRGLVDEHCTVFNNPVTGVQMKMEDAMKQGLVTGSIETHSESETTINAKKPTGSFNITGVIDTNNAKVISPASAVDRGILDPSGKYINTLTGEVVPLADALKDGLIISEEKNKSPYIKASELKGNQSLTFREAMRRGLINPNTGTFLDEASQKMYNVDEAVRTGLVVASDGRPFTYKGISDDGMTYSFNSALQTGIIDPENCLFYDSMTGDSISIECALEEGYLSPIAGAHGSKASGSSIVMLKEGVAPTSSSNSDEILDSRTGEKLSLQEAERRGLVDVVGDENKMTLDNAIQSGLVDTDSGLFHDPISGKTMPLDQALLCEFVAPGAHDNTDNSMDTSTDSIGNRATRPDSLTLADAVSQGYIDTAKGLFTDPRSEETVTVSQALQRGYIKPSLTVGQPINNTDVYDDEMLQKREEFAPMTSKRVANANMATPSSRHPENANDMTDSMLQTREEFAPMTSKRGAEVNMATPSSRHPENAIDMTDSLFKKREEFAPMTTKRGDEVNMTTPSSRHPEDANDVTDGLFQKREEFAPMTTKRGDEVNIATPSSRHPENANDMTDSIQGVFREDKFDLKNSDPLVSSQSPEDFSSSFDGSTASTPSFSGRMGDSYDKLMQDLAAEHQKVHRLEHILKEDSQMGDEVYKVQSQLEAQKAVHEEVMSHQQPILSLFYQAEQLTEHYQLELTPEQVTDVSSEAASLKKAMEKVVKTSDRRIKHLNKASEELGKFETESDKFITWKDGSNKELEWLQECLRRFEDLKPIQDKQGELLNDIMSHQADIRFMSIAVQKYMEEAKLHKLEVESFRADRQRPARSSLISMDCVAADNVKDKLRDLSEEYNDLKSRCSSFGDQLGDINSKQRGFNDSAFKMLSWLTDAEDQLASIKQDSGTPDPDLLHSQLDRVKSLSSDALSQSGLMEDVCKKGHDLTNSLSGLPADKRQVAKLVDNMKEIEARYSTVCDAVNDQAKLLQATITQSQDIQGAVSDLLNWLDSAERAMATEQPIALDMAKLSEQEQKFKMVASDVNSHGDSVTSVRKAAHDLIKSGDLHMARELEQKLLDIEDRFTDLKHTCHEKDDAFHEVSSKLGNFQDKVDSCQNWLQNNMDDLNSSDMNQLSTDEASDKLAVMAKDKTKLENEIAQLKSVAQDLKEDERTGNPAPINQAIGKLEKSLNDLDFLIGEKEAEVEQREQQGNEYEAAKTMLLLWLAQVEAVIDEFDPAAVEVALIEKQLAQLQQENMSKKNMDNQQYDMAQTIQQLQEENRILRQKLSAARKREFEKDGSSQGESVRHIPVVVVYENNHSGDPLKEITTDEPISPINPQVQSDVPTTKTPGASFLTDREDNPREISVNVLELVGSYTPIQSTFCMEKDCNDDGIKRKRGSAVGSNEESGISEDDGGRDSLTDSGGRRSEKGSSISGDEFVMDQMRNRDGDLCQEQRIMGPLSQPPRNPIVSNVQMYATDTETESCTSNDLEYTYSDMSLKSEATSSRTSKSSKTHGEVTFDSLDHGDFENVDGFDCNGGKKMAKDFNADMDTTANDCGGNGNNQSSDLSPTNDTTGNGDHTSDFLSTNTTKNESSVELDAFKLCRMKFNTADDGHDKQSRNNLFDISNSQPRLIYSSKHVEQNRMEEEEEDQTCDFVCDSFRASRIMINASQEDKKQTPDWSQFHSSRNSFYPSFDLSVIPSQEPAGSFSFVPRSASSFPVRQSSDPAGDNRRKTMEPVYMSTPVADTVRHHGTSTKPVGRKKSTLAKRVLMRQQQEKENQSPLSSQGSGRSRSSNSISSTADLSTSRFHKREVSSFGATPKSSIPPSQRQRILLSMDRLEANRSYSCNDLTFDRDVGMTTLFDRAEHQRTVGAGGQSLPLEDKEELERLIEQVRIGESERSGVSPSMDVGDSSILKAVLGVGDAMADFVQATADVQMRKMESTHL